MGQRIKTSCLNQGLEEPQIREQGDFVDVVFYRPVAEVGNEVSDTASDKVSDTVGALPNHKERVMTFRITLYQANDGQH